MKSEENVSMSSSTLSSLNKRYHDFSKEHPYLATGLDISLAAAAWFFMGPGYAVGAVIVKNMAEKTSTPGPSIDDAYAQISADIAATNQSEEQQQSVRSAVLEHNVIKKIEAEKEELKEENKQLRKENTGLKRDLECAQETIEQLTLIVEGDNRRPVSLVATAGIFANGAAGNDSVRLTADEKQEAKLK